MLGKVYNTPSCGCSSFLISSCSLLFVIIGSCFKRLIHLSLSIDFLFLKNGPITKNVPQSVFFWSKTQSVIKRIYC